MVTCEQVVSALKTIGRSVKAAQVAYYMGTDSRAVATALRKATKDGRVTITYRKNFGWYRFVRSKAK